MKLRECSPAGLDDSARKIAQEDGSLRVAVDHLLHLKFSNADPFHQLGALDGTSQDGRKQSG